MKIRRRRFAALTAALTPKAKPLAGRCNYPMKDGRAFCRLSAGKHTPHPGSGYCATHEKSEAYDPIHRYRHIQQKDIRKQLMFLESKERNIFDMIPEIQLLRAMLVDYVERHYIFKEALMKWYKDGKMKPKGPFDIIDAAHLIESVSRLIERHHRIERAGSIDLSTFHRACEQMGIIVAKHVRDGKVLAAIEDDWARVSLDTKSSPSILPQPPSPTLSLPEASNGKEK
jgi:hypothetical protein